MAYSDQEWWSLEITVAAEAAEAVESALNEAGALGTEINLLGLQAAPAETIVIGYFNERPDEQELELQLSDGLRIYGYGEGSLIRSLWSKVEDRDWLAEWKKHWKPTEIGRFIIAPPWAAVEETDKIVIRIEPNMAFGTGTHETTRLCLETIAELYRPDQTFLDVGTGTGILAIAVAKLATENTEKGDVDEDSPATSVAKILGCDTDADSVRIALENGMANGARAHIEIYEGSINDQTPAFDFVCANLTIDVIVPILPILLEKSREILLLSGILLEQKAIIAAELEKFQISNFKFQILGEWVSVTVLR